MLKINGRNLRKKLDKENGEIEQEVEAFEAKEKESEA